MRPVRFVALSEDGQALVLADEVGRLLALPIDERVARRAASRPAATADRSPIAAVPTIAASVAVPPRHPGPHPVRRDRRRGRPRRRRAGRPGAALRRPGAAGAGHAGPARAPHPAEELRQGRAPRRGRRRAGSAQHGIDTEKISWDAYRREDGTWRIVATWPSGKATAQAIWELDKARQRSRRTTTWRSTCAPSAHPDPRPGPARAGHEPGGRGSRAAAATACPAAGRAGPASEPRPDPGRPRRAARLAGPPAGRRPRRGVSTAPAPAARRAQRSRRRGRAARRPGLARSTTTRDAPKEVPAVPSLAVLRPRRTGRRRGSDGDRADKPRKRLPSWDDVLFGGGAARRPAKAS